MSPPTRAFLPRYPLHFSYTYLLVGLKVIIIGAGCFPPRLGQEARFQLRGKEEDATDQVTPLQARSGGMRTRQSILDAAKAVFADKGYSGAHVNDIVARAGTTKPMIYYHFGNKEGLFAAVLEDVYAGMRQIEASLHLADKPVEEAMRLLVQVTFNYHAEHPDWVRLISIANIHHAEHLVKSPTVASRNTAVFDFLEILLARGVGEGVFRSGIRPAAFASADHLAVLLPGVQPSHLESHLQARFRHGKRSVGAA